MLTVEQAREMGRRGATVDDHERLLFEAWMDGHCWKCGQWVQFPNGEFAYDDMTTRVLWAAWRDRAALQNNFIEGVHKGSDGHRYMVARVSEKGEDEFA